MFPKGGFCICLVRRKEEKVAEYLYLIRAKRDKGAHPVFDRVEMVEESTRNPYIIFGNLPVDELSYTRK